MSALPDEVPMPLDPIVSQMFAKMIELGRPALSAGTPEDARALTASSRAALGPGPDMHSVRELTIPTRGGAIAARLFLPQTGVAGLIVYLHGGGGWVVGELDDFDALARTLAARSRCGLLLPAYRLAPEHPYPAGLEDAEDAILWAAGRVAEPAGAPVPLVLAGDSAGGNLAAVALHGLTGCAAIAAQVLIYPVTDADTDTPSYRAFSQGMQMTRQDMQWFFGHYAPPGLHRHPRISPLRQPPRADLPPTLVVTAECDVLRDDGEAYAERLAAAGVGVTARRIDGMPHGFIRMHNLVDGADRALTGIAGDIAAFCAQARR